MQTNQNILIAGTLYVIMVLRARRPFRRQSGRILLDWLRRSVRQTGRKGAGTERDRRAKRIPLHHERREPGEFELKWHPLLKEAKRKLGRNPTTVMELYDNSTALRSEKSLSLFSVDLKNFLTEVRQHGRLVEGGTDMPLDELSRLVSRRHSRDVLTLLTLAENLEKERMSSEWQDRVARNMLQR